MTKFGILAAYAAMLATTSAAAQSFPVGATGELAARLLSAHNRERAAVGAPPLEWDQKLADHAASYGPVLARLHHLVHSPRDDRPGERENLAMAWHGTLSPEELVGLWSKERLLLEPGSYIFPGRSRTGNWEDTAHYTQMVWPTTTRVGCAIYSADWDYLVCRYSPPATRTVSRSSLPPPLAPSVAEEPAEPVRRPALPRRKSVMPTVPEASAGPSPKGARLASPAGVTPAHPGNSVSPHLVYVRTPDVSSGER